MLELKRWLREFKEEAPWYFWLLAIPTAILAPLCEYFSVTLMIIFSLSCSAFFLKKYNLLNSHKLYLIVILSLFVTIYPIYIELFAFLDSNGITKNISFYLLLPHSYLLYSLITIMLELPIIYLFFKFKKIDQHCFFAASLCAATMTMANAMIIYIVVFLFFVFISFL